MPDNQSRNMIIFVILAGVILIGYDFLFIQPQAKREAALRAKQAPAVAAAGLNGITTPGAPGVTPVTAILPRAQALAADPRIAVKTPALAGSISLRGARFDDLFLTGYREKLEKNSPPVELFRPKHSQNAYFAELGWVGADAASLPGADTLWTVEGNTTLAPGAPVTLTYTSPAGMAFTRVVSVDERFMFTVTDTAANYGAAPVVIAPYASVQRQGLPANAGRSGAHEGAVAILGGELKMEKYQPLKKKGSESFPSKGGWVGMTDKYWLAAVAPAATQSLTSYFRVVPSNGVDIYEVNYNGGPISIAPGKQTTTTTHLYAGAKVVPVLQDYTKKLGIPRLEDAVDWGLLQFISKPIFMIIEFFYRLVHNFGIAILLMTVLVKVLFFYPANLSFASMTKMKKLQPQLEELKVKNKGDPAKQQQEMMALYQREKINPLMGCLPMLATIPVFLGLFKVLNVTIEMRHAPFFGWIQDLSGRDPLTIINLFRLIPWDPAHTPVIGPILDNYLHIGPWAIAYGATMWLTTSMNPPQADPMQQRIFQWMPVIFTFTLAQFAVGLLIYYTWSNLLTIVQQYVIMRRFKVDTPIDAIIRRIKGTPGPAT